MANGVVKLPFDCDCGCWRAVFEEKIVVEGVLVELESLGGFEIQRDLWLANLYCDIVDCGRQPN